MSKLNGKIAAVTGGPSGIGLAAAKRFVEEGASASSPISHGQPGAGHFSEGEAMHA